MSDDTHEDTPRVEGEARKSLIRVPSAPPAVLSLPLQSLAPGGVKTRGLSHEDMAELREIFSLVDKDGGGTISKMELGELLMTLGIRATNDDLDLMIREVDIDGSGEIDFGEFIQVMQRRVNVPYTAADVRAAFKVFDNGAPPGYIKVQDLLTALTVYGGAAAAELNLTEEKIAELVAQMEPDGQGLINYADFVGMMLDT